MTYVLFKTFGGLFLPEKVFTEKKIYTIVIKPLYLSLYSEYKIMKSQYHMSKNLIPVSCMITY